MVLILILFLLSSSFVYSNNGDKKTEAQLKHKDASLENKTSKTENFKFSAIDKANYYDLKKQLKEFKYEFLNKIEELENKTDLFNHEEEWEMYNTSSGAIQIEPLSFKPRNCKEILQKQINSPSGFYIIYPYDWAPNKSIQVKCDMTNGTGWTLIQKRDNVVNYRISFYRNHAEYEEGFRNRENEEFWIGLKTIHSLTSQSTTKLRVDMWDFEGEHRYAIYQYFHVSHARDDYRLEVQKYSGNAGDSLSYHHNMSFSTYDKDLDKSARHCAKACKGGWWYNNCQYVNLNGLYNAGNYNDHTGVEWYIWKKYYSLRKVEMKVHPTF